ncbi:hypothetical protein BT96DRAFT_947694 [Gymnopus androsaceus JB14]|uniref:Uncharacterized protein n=1 Tax=Gymnopus androsaceus JB14 TaxID=1447944 RepID=A0A6A4GT22_9AGAR|nr:hypothetical protein BT96DRAFT_947694 [Gymnopus androsaceus JB14]
MAMDIDAPYFSFAPRYYFNGFEHSEVLVWSTDNYIFALDYNQNLCWLALWCFRNQSHKEILALTVNCGYLSLLPTLAETKLIDTPLAGLQDILHDPFLYRAWSLFRDHRIACLEQVKERHNEVHPEMNCATWAMETEPGGNHLVMRGGYTIMYEEPSTLGQSHEADHRLARRRHEEIGHSAAGEICDRMHMDQDEHRYSSGYSKIGSSAPRLSSEADHRCSKAEPGDKPSLDMLSKSSTPKTEPGGRLLRYKGEEIERSYPALKLHTYDFLSATGWDGGGGKKK